MFRKLFSYFKTLFGMKADAMMSPEVQLQQIMQNARTEDAKLEAKVESIDSHKIQVGMDLAQAGEQLAKVTAEAQTTADLIVAAEAKEDTAEVERFTSLLNGMAPQIEIAQGRVDDLTQQYKDMEASVAEAMELRRNNEAEVQRLGATIMRDVGKLRHAEVTEQFNNTLKSLGNNVVDTSQPTLTEIESKINKKMADAMAGTNMQKGSLAGAQRELETEMRKRSASSTVTNLLDAARAKQPAPALTPAPVAPKAKTTKAKTTSKSKA